MTRKLALAAVIALGVSPSLAAQNTLITPGSPLTMVGLATFLNSAFQSVATNYSGSTPPAVCAGGTACTYQFWLDTSTTPTTLRIYDATQWVSIGSLDTVGHTFSVAVSQVPAARGGSTDAISDSDRGSLIRYTNASATAATIAQAGASSQFPSGWYVDVRAASTGTVTVTPAVSTINGLTSLTLPPGLSVRIVSDGSNYFTSQTIGTPTVAVIGGVFSKAAVSSNWLRSLGTDGIFTASQPAFSDLSGSAACSQLPAITGDVTTSAGSCATTLTTAQPAVHTWALAQTFTVAPVFTDRPGSRAALGFGSAAASGTILRADGTDWAATTATYPTTTTINQILYSSSANVIAGLATSNSGVLVTSAGGVPSISTTLPNGIALGVATATSINKVAFTAPATSATLTIADGKTLTASNSITLAGTDGVILTGPSTNATLAALNISDQTITGGAIVTTLAQSTGNITVDCGARPIQSITNGGAFTITAPASDGYCILAVTNNASAGAITFTGFSVGTNTGDALTTTNTNKFFIFIYRAGGSSTYSVKALQ